MRVVILVVLALSRPLCLAALRSKPSAWDFEDYIRLFLEAVLDGQRLRPPMLGSRSAEVVMSLTLNEHILALSRGGCEGAGLDDSMRKRTRDGHDGVSVSERLGLTGMADTRNQEGESYEDMRKPYSGLKKTRVRHKLFGT